MRTYKKQEIFNKILKHCPNNDNLHRHAKNGHRTFINKAIIAQKPQFSILLLDPSHNASQNNCI